jgi:hypothetical protein
VTLVRFWTDQAEVEHEVDTVSFPHRVIRLTFDTGQRYEAFRARYENAVPELDSKQLADFVDGGATWREVVKDADASKGESVGCPLPINLLEQFASKCK